MLGILMCYICILYLTYFYLIFKECHITKLVYVVLYCNIE